MCENEKRRRIVNTKGLNVKRIVKAAIVCMLTFCMLAGSAALASPANATRNTKRAFSNTDYSNYIHAGRYDGSLIVNGVDVSDWQSKNCNWSEAKAAGVDYAIMRVTWSGYGIGKLKTRTDSAFANNFKNAKKAGVMCGVYVFSQAKNAKEAVQEADYAVARLKALGIGPKDLALPVYMDYEFAGGRFGRLYGLSKSSGTSAATAFCNRIKSYGYTPGVYANITFFNNQLDTSKFASDVDLWCAQYYNRCQSGIRYSKWQYSSSAKIDGLLSWTGIKGRIDVNYWYIDRNVNRKALTTIKGRTTLSLRDARNPKFTITRGKTTLKQGRDYIVGGIRNNRRGTAYAYIKGIGKYGGYALVPLKVTNRTTGSANANLNGKCANYLTYASKAKSVSTGGSSYKATSFKKGKTYTVNTELNVRTGAGTGYSRVKRSALSSAAKKVTYSGTYAVIKPGTKVKCLKVSGSWIKVQVKVSGKWKGLSGGWICTGMDGEAYVN